MIDTEDKRRSAMGSPGTHVLPVPKGSLDQADRQHIIWIYRGILAGPSVVPSLVNYFASVSDIGGYTATVQVT